jgi:hypothetical protein
MITQPLHPRESYLKKILAFRDTDLIKVLTGVRRCGKSTLLTLAKERLESEGVPGRAFISLNLESKKCPITSEDDLYHYVEAHLAPAGRTYLFLDEPQRLPGWQHAVNAMRVDFDIDIYLTGSNAFLLSSDLSTYLSGRYIETQVLPLALREYLDFCGLTFAPGSQVTLSPTGEPVLFDDVLVRYLRYGGFPAIANLEVDQAMHAAYLESVYDAVAVRDIINRERAYGASAVTNAALLKSIATFLADNVGNRSSAGKIAGALAAGGEKTTNKTVASYLGALCDAYLFYQALRYDLHGKELLTSNPKYYLVDPGLRSLLLGYRMSDMGRVFENAVYLELRYQGYHVHVGKLYQKEVDFVAEKNGERAYVQVTDSMTTPETRERELAPLKAIKDAYSKLVVTRQAADDKDIEGIRVLSPREFFLA